MKALAFFFALIAFCLSVSVASAQNGASGTMTLSDYTWNPCCGEWIDWTLEVHYVLDKETGYFKHWQYESGYAWGGWPSYTRDYTLDKSVTNVHYNDNGKGQNYTYTASMKFTSADGCGFTMHVTYHYTISVTGELTASVDNVVITCDNGFVPTVE